MPGRISKERNQYFIRLERGTLCEVSREVYLCWYAGERQERYQIDRDRRNGVFSLDAISYRMFQENGSCFEEVIPSMEEGIEEQVERKFLTEKLYQAIRKLKPDERELICALFFEEVSLRSYARRKGVTHRAVQKWRDVPFISGNFMPRKDLSCFGVFYGNLSVINNHVYLASGLISSQGNSIMIAFPDNNVVFTDRIG